MNTAILPLCYSILHGGKALFHVAFRSQTNLSPLQRTLWVCAEPNTKSLPNACADNQCKQLHQCLKMKKKKAVISKLYLQWEIYPEDTDVQITSDNFAVQRDLM